MHEIKIGVSVTQTLCKISQKLSLLLQHLVYCCKGS